MSSPSIEDVVLETNEDYTELASNGKEFNSVEFSQFIEKRMNTGMDLVFVIGGPFGFSKEEKGFIIYIIRINIVNMS